MEKLRPRAQCPGAGVRGDVSGRKTLHSKAVQTHVLVCELAYANELLKWWAELGGPFRCPGKKNTSQLF